MTYADTPAELPPEAASSDDALKCPVCDYELRGLPEPRCPECGYAFEWAELREQARRRQLWFYEHSGTFKSHRQTRWRSLRPWSFWRGIHAYSDAHSGRLAIYAVTTLLLTAIVSGVLIVSLPALGEWSQDLQSYLQRTYFLPSSSWGMRRRPTLQPWYVEWLYWGTMVVNARAVENIRPLVVAAAMAGVWVVGMAAYFKLLSGSVLRARIKPIHLARVNAYSADVLPWLLMLLTCVMVFGPYLRWVWRGVVPLLVTRGVVWHAMVLPLVVIVPLTLRLHGALRRYVRFPQPGGVAAGFAIIMWLVWAIVAIQTMSMRDF